MYLLASILLHYVGSCSHINTLKENVNNKEFAANLLVALEVGQGINEYMQSVYVSEDTRNSSNTFILYKHPCLRGIRDRGFESHLGMDVCVCSVCVFSVST
jgi:phosphomannomutase